MINTPYFNFEEIEAIINNPKDLKNYFENNSLNEGPMLQFMPPVVTDEPAEEYDNYENETDEYEEDEAEENDVENMSDHEKVKLAYEILSMTSYEDEFFMSILGRLRKIMRK